MPCYLYRCVECGHRFERVLAMEERGNVECESCGGTVRIVPPRTHVHIPSWMGDSRISREAAEEPSGLLAQDERRERERATV